MEKNQNNGEHKPVLLAECLDALKVREFVLLNNQACFIDATLGSAGHTIEILKLGGKVLGIDTDIDALKNAEEKISQACPSPYQKVGGQFTPVHGNFRHIDTIAKEKGFSAVEGILFDLGVSSPQLISATRGFSFRNPNATLDMRLDRKNTSVTAADLLNVLPKQQIIELFGKVIEWSEAKRLSEAVIKQRSEHPYVTVGDFIEVAERSVRRKSKINPATKPFMALRMAVNSELENLADALPKALNLLKTGGRLAVISFHSGEDALVKHYFKDWEIDQKGSIVGKNPIIPDESEISYNPRARSAKLRIFEKL